MNYKSRMLDERCKVCGRDIASHSIKELVGCASHIIGFVKVVYFP